MAVLLGADERRWLLAGPVVALGAYGALAVAAKWLTPYVTTDGVGTENQRCWQVTERLGSLAHATFATTMGALITREPACVADMINGKSKYLVAASSISVTYLVLDTLIITYQHMRFGDRRGHRDIGAFRQQHGLILAHHAGVIACAPILVLRIRKGDYFFGYFFQCEASSAFMTLRQMLISAGLEHFHVYTLNGLAFAAAFFWARILQFPRMFADLAGSYGEPWYMAPRHLRPCCWLGSLPFVALQLYWFRAIVLGIVHRFTAKSKRS